MPVVEPKDAAFIADIVYRIQYINDISKYFTDDLLSKFQLDAGSRFNGDSGALTFFKSRTGFGVVAKGIGSFEKEALLAVRGTDSLADGLTDFHTSLQISKTGKLVHAGFNKTFNSFFDPVSQFLAKNKPIRVHCVGHSLGGALATLAADWISHSGMSQANLYTFGSPRVGNQSFAAECTGQIKTENIYRVHHKTDAVSLVPIWPFFHTPLPGIDCYIETPGTMPGAEYHKISRYKASVDNQGWASLRKSPPETSLDEHIKIWLNSSENIVSFTVTTVTMVQRALVFILKKIAYLAGITIQLGLIAGFTFLDQLAMILEKGAHLSKEVAGWVTALMQKILRAVGVVVNGVNVTVKFIRWVLSHFSETIYRLARAAIRYAHNDIITS